MKLMQIIFNNLATRQPGDTKLIFMLCYETCTIFLDEYLGFSMPHVSFRELTGIK